MLSFLLFPAWAGAADPGPLLDKLKAVGAEGEGNAEASKAWKQLVQMGPDALLPTLAAMKGAEARALNWLRPAVDAIAERTLASGQSLPAKKLEQFVLEKQNQPQARRLAYEWLVRVDGTAAQRLVPGFLQDPSAGLRRDAVAVVMDQAEAILKKDDKAAALAAYRKALSGARDHDQVEAIAKQLKNLGVEVDLAAHYGFVRTWWLVTPFDNTDGKGYKTVYPPEKGVDLSQTYVGKKNAEARWTSHTTTDPHGKVDLNQALDKLKGAVAYAYTVIDSPKEQKIEIRAGCITALKIFLDGKLIFAREEYHHGMSMDQHVGFATLRAGRNELLIKVCQNEQTEAWAQKWEFQVRLCDAVGGAVPFKVAEIKGGAKQKGRSEQ